MEETNFSTKSYLNYFLYLKKLFICYWNPLIYLVDFLFYFIINLLSHRHYDSQTKFIINFINQIFQRDLNHYCFISFYFSLYLLSNFHLLIMLNYPFIIFLFNLILIWFSFEIFS